MYKAIFFDLDNTLLYPNKSIIDQMIDLRIDGTLLFTPDNAKKAYRDAELWTAQQILHEIESDTRMADELFYKNVLSQYMKHAAIKTEYANTLISTVLLNRTDRRPMAGIQGFLAALAENYALGIVSNNSTSVRCIFEEYGLTKYFQVILISEEIGIEKPNPQILLKACDALCVRAEDCLYVGDHPFDILCASSANMDCAWLDNGIFEEDDLPAIPKYRITSVYDIEKVFEVTPDSVQQEYHRRV